MPYRLLSLQHNADIMVVGCGGTGGFVAEGLCRLMIGTDYKLVLVDHDRVEESNLGRQNFVRADLGRFKAQVLAERFALNYGREVTYSTSRIEDLALNDRGYLTIGCVDNPTARRRLQWAGVGSFMTGRIGYHKSGGDGCWYIDAGNGQHSGQVLIGNCLLKECERGFFPETGVCAKLPLPQLQQPALLAPEAKPAQRDCAQRVAAAEQSPVINQMMASLVLTFVHKLITDSLTWMGAYIDLESGSLSPVEASPEAVSRITGVSEKRLTHLVRKERVRVRV